VSSINFTAVSYDRTITDTSTGGGLSPYLFQNNSTNATINLPYTISAGSSLDLRFTTMGMGQIGSGQQLTVTSAATGGSPAKVIINSDLQVLGNDIKDGNDDVVITMSGDGNKLTTLAGDIKVTGNTIKSSTADALELLGADVEVKGDLRVSGNDIKSSTGAVAIQLTGSDVTISGNETVKNNLVVTGTLTSVGAITGSAGMAVSGGESKLSSLTVSDLTSGRVVLAGQAGSIDDSANLTFANGQLGVTGSLGLTGLLTGSTAQFSGLVRLASASIDSIAQPGVVIAGANGLLTTTASLFYADNRLEVSSSIRVSGDLAVNGESGTAVVSSNALTVSLFDNGVDTIYIGNDAELVDIGAAAGVVTIAGDLTVGGNDIKDSSSTTRITMFDGVAVLSTQNVTGLSDGDTVSYSGDQGSITLPTGWASVAISLVAAPYQRTFAIPTLLSDASTSVRASVSWSGTTYAGGQNIVVAAYATGTITLEGLGGGNFANGSIAVTSYAPNVDPTVEISADLRVKGNDIKDSRNDVIVSFSGDGEKLTTFAGDIKIAGNDIRSSDGLVTIKMSGRNVDAAGSLAVSGSSLSFVGDGIVRDASIDLKTGGALKITGGDLSNGLGAVKIKMSGSELGFSDAYMLGTWTSGDAIPLAKSTGEWQGFKSAFGEVSLLAAIQASAGGFGDGVHVYKAPAFVNSPASIAGTSITRPDGTNFTDSFLATNAAARNENIKLYLNGQLMVSKSFDAANYDYDVPANGANITFNFSIEADDTIIAIVPRAVASTEDYISTIGYDLCGSVQGKPASSEVVFKLIMPRTAMFNSGYAYADVASASTLSLTIQKGIASGGTVTYSNIGTISFTAGSSTGTVSWTGGYQTVNREEVLRVIAPSVVDATFSSPVFTLIGLEA
jgi:hypothetical protein